VPLVVAGDHSAPPVVVRARDGSRPSDNLHHEAPRDIRVEVGGLRAGDSSQLLMLFRPAPQIQTVANWQN
jgi:hypothetical protein